jgi:glycine hydroxymethyltransferase
LETAAITSRGLKEKHMSKIVDLIDEVITNFNDESKLNLIGDKVIKMMKKFPIYPKV